MSEKVSCYDCKWGQNAPYCSNPALINKPWRDLASQARKEEHGCGPDAKLFEPKRLPWFKRLFRNKGDGR